MEDASRPELLDRAEVRRLFDLRGSFNSFTGGGCTDDPYPVWHARRAEAPVHEGVLHELSGHREDWLFQGLPFPDRPHFTAFTFEACDEAFRDPKTFASAPVDDAAGPGVGGGGVGVQSSMLSMGGAQHRRYRSLVQPSFVPAKAKWWVERWIARTVDGLIDAFADEGRAELNVDFAAAIPVLTITGSFGVDVGQALVIRETLMTNPMKTVEILSPIVAARREAPRDDLVTVLVEAEYTDDDGISHRLSDEEIFSFAILLLAAGSGTTWKQLGITLTALLERPALLHAVRADPSLVRPAIEEAVRWMPTDPMFSRHVARDVDFHGVHLPRGSVLHLCLGAANRDPARWERPDEFDITRPPKGTLAFGSGPHVCLGMHVARAEIATATTRLLERLPDLRLDPAAPAPSYVGFYERGATAIPVVFEPGGPRRKAGTR
jgi:cytochrome P450